jgi:nucleoside-diphosphate-sugar epimerase
LTKTPVLILGGGGAVGKCIAANFSGDKNFQISSPSSLECDLTHKKSIEYIKQYSDHNLTIIFSSTISRLVEDSFRSLSLNIKMAHNLAAALKEMHFKNIIFFSSIDVYGRPPPVDGEITEDSLISPAGYYGYSKLVSEYILEQEVGYARGLSILRLPGVFSLEKDDPSIVGDLFNKILCGRDIVLTGSGRQVRTFLYVGDLIYLCKLIIEREWRGKSNVTSSKALDLLSYVKAMQNVLNKRVKIHFSEENKNQFNLNIANGRIASDFGLKLNQSFEFRLKEILSQKIK